MITRFSVSTSKKKCLTLLTTGLLFALISAHTQANTQANTDSKSDDQQKSNQSKSRSRTPTNPNDYPELIDVLESLHQGAVEHHLGAHVEQDDLESLPADLAFITAFELGDELFEISFNALDGVGVKVGNGKRFSGIPRLDLSGAEQWASVTPLLKTGPNGDSCLACHNQPVADGAGGINDNTVRIDPERLQSGHIERQAPHIFGMGGVQLLAEEMTTELQTIRDSSIAESCASGRRQSVSLDAKGINFGTIKVRCNNIDFSNLDGIDTDLVVKPFEWKGLTAFVRDFIRGASHQELGMQATELVGDIDSDFDGISNEFSVGDITALAIYAAGQQRPVSKLELNQISDLLTEQEQADYGIPLSSAEIQDIENGAQVFEQASCASCHAPALTVAAPIFYEPSKHAHYSDSQFPAGSSVSLPQVAIQFDITEDIFVNPQTLANGQTLGVFERNDAGEAIVRLYGDLKRHDMGQALAEEIDEGHLGASVFMTENLWGVGSTAPYLHDGRATTLTEAILYHGGEADASKKLFVELSQQDQENLLTFLNSLVLYLED